MNEKEEQIIIFNDYSGDCFNDSRLHSKEDADTSTDDQEQEEAADAVEAEEEDEDSEKESSGELTKIRVGTQPTTIGVPAQYALEKGYFKEEGLDVDLVLFPTGAPLNEAIAAGELDVAANGLASVFP